MNTQQALQLAFQHLNSGNLMAAHPLFNSILQREPQNFAALNGRGFIALQQNQLPQALADLQQSLSVNPKQAFSQKMAGIVLGALGRFDESMSAFAAALALNATDPEVYFNRANFRFQAGQVQEALADLDAAIKLRGSYLEARSNRANLLIQLGEFARAEKDLDYLVNKVTNNPDIWVALGFVRYKLGKLREAMQCNDRALKLVPNHPDALLNSSSTSFEQKDYEASVSWAERAREVTPHRAEVFYAKANALAAMSRFDDAVSEYDQAIRLNPGYAEAFNARGLAKAALRQLEAAEADYNAAIKLRPDFHDAIYNKSYTQLEHGDFAGGWQGYEHRFNVPTLGILPLTGIPEWTGLPVAGDLLIRGEQGLGDQILFGSVLPSLLVVQDRVILQLEKRLVPLFARSFPTVRVIGMNEKLPVTAKAQVSIGSLPRYFRRSKADFSGVCAPYLVADHSQVADFREKLTGGAARCVIGLSWRSFNNRFTDHKSMALSDLAPLFNLPNVSVVDLQYGETSQEKLLAQDCGCQFNDAVRVDLTKDIDGLASLISACDVIVTVSNTTAHIAGALGKPVLLMLPHRTGKLWYWSEAQGEGSLWYPSIKTFHQSAQGDWAGTIEKIVNCLQQ